MKSYFNGQRYARRATTEESADVKRQITDKDAKSREESDEKSIGFVVQIRTGLRRIEKRMDKLVQGIEERLWPDESKEDVTEEQISSDIKELFADLKRIETKVTKHSEIEERLVKRYVQQSSERRKLERVFEEVRMERDVLLEKIHSYLEQISSLKSKVEEQRCSIGAYERQVNAEYEIHLRKLESMNEDLRIASMQKEKQLKDANEQLRQMQKTLRSYELLSWRKKNEESVFISILKNDLQAIWNDKMKMEEEFKRLKKKCGYNEDDSRWRLSSEECLGSLLRRSRSMSDLTLNVHSAAEMEEYRKEITARISSTPTRSSKTSRGRDVTMDLLDSSEATTAISTPEVKNSAEEDTRTEKSATLTKSGNVTKDC